MSSDLIAIVGGGPAGALAASILAKAGRKVVLIDEHLAWEKPCGGGITHKALRQYPFLADAQVSRNWIRGCELISPGGRRAWFELDHPIAIFSRHTLNDLLLQRARSAGAEIVRDHVSAVETTARGWRLQTRTSHIEVSYVIVAAGARTALRAHFSSPLAPEDLMMTAGYFIPGTGDSIQIKFIQGLHGYAWIFPRR